MAKFLSGPPGGRTLPLTTARLSDLAGGVYGPGASVASTGINAGRPVIKTANARAAGETWEDLLEYYLVGGMLQQSFSLLTYFLHSSTQTEVKLTLHTASARSIIRVASTAALAALLLEEMAPVPYLATFIKPGITSYELHAPFGRLILRIHAMSSISQRKMRHRVLHMPRWLLATWDECFFGVRG